MTEDSNPDGTADTEEPDKPSFETRLERLEEIVDRLESDKLSLEESLDLYEEGVTLVKECRERLEEAEQKIEILNEQGEKEQIQEEDLK